MTLTHYLNSNHVKIFQIHLKIYTKIFIQNFKMKLKLKKGKLFNKIKIYHLVIIFILKF